METKSNQQFEITVFTKDKIICKRYFEDYNFKKNEIECSNQNNKYSE